MKNENRDPPEKSVVWAGFTGSARADLETDSILSALGPDPMSPARAEYIKRKDDKGSMVFRAEADLGSGPREVFIKTYSRPRLLGLMLARVFSAKGLKRPWHYPAKAARMCFETGPSRLSRLAAAACREAGVAVAEPVLFLERGFGPWRCEVLVSLGAGPRKEPHAFAHFNRYFAGPLDRSGLKQKREAIRRLGALLARVRASGVRFPDFKLTNLVLVEDEGGPSFVVVDLSEARVGRFDYPEALFLRRFSPHVLKSPAFSGRDQVRLVKAYLDAGDDPRSWSEICDLIGARRVL